MHSAARMLVAWFLCVVLPWAAAPARAETFCKWVDADGTTHYAAECPREVDGRLLDVDAPPDFPRASEPASAEATNEGAASTGGESGAEAGGAADLRAPRTAEELEAAAYRAAQRRAEAACDDALRRLDELSTALPIYRDGDGAVHADETLHHWWYRGPRTYLDAPQRRAAFADAQADAARLCGSRIDEARPRVATFTRAPLPRDVISWLERPATSPVPLEALCDYANRLARNLRRDRSNDPSDDMRRLDELLPENCGGR